MFLGAINAFTGEAGKGDEPVTGETAQTFPQIARDLQGQGHAAGSWSATRTTARARAASTPRCRRATSACAAVIVRSFARIHETNLKKQGILPLTFAKPSDYDLFEQADRVSVRGLAALAPGKPVEVVIHKAGRQDGDDPVPAHHDRRADRLVQGGLRPERPQITIPARRPVHGGTR